MYTSTLHNEDTYKTIATEIDLSVYNMSRQHSDNIETTDIARGTEKLIFSTSDWIYSTLWQWTHSARMKPSGTVEKSELQSSIVAICGWISI